MDDEAESKMVQGANIHGSGLENNHGYYYVSRQVSGNGAYMGQKLVIHEGTVKVL